MIIMFIVVTIMQAGILNMHVSQRQTIVVGKGKFVACMQKLGVSRKKTFRFRIQSRLCQYRSCFPFPARVSFVKQGILLLWP